MMKKLFKNTLFLYGLLILIAFFLITRQNISAMLMFLFFTLSFLGIAFLSHAILKQRNIQYEYQNLQNKAKILSESVIKNVSNDSKDVVLQNSKNDIKDSTPFSIYSPDEKSITLKNIAGYHEVKEEIKEVIDFLKNPSKYLEMGAEIPHGILFMGPPGTGKTLLARAVAGEAGVKFIYCSGSEFVEKYAGVGAARVRQLFAQAKENNEPCIIFIDEIDAIGGTRNANNNDAEKDKTLNQLLVEMDGFEKNNNFIVIAATNRKDMLDEALLRPGRFDRHILIPLPTLQERKEVLQLHAQGKKIDTIDFNALAKKTTGFSNAQLNSLLNEAALLAVRHHQSLITEKDIEESIDRVLMGPARKSQTYNDEERRLVAYHEAGHAVAGLVLKSNNHVERITIIPRGDAGGYTLSSPDEETFFSTKSSIHDKIVSLLSGRAAEELISNDITNGASNDIERATQLARHYVGTFGMSELGLMKIDSQVSQETASQYDKMVKDLLNECHSVSLKTLSENKILLDSIANSLLENETINAKEIEEIQQNIQQKAAC